jgi:hypothetical protein
MWSYCGESRELPDGEAGDSRRQRDRVFPAPGCGTVYKVTALSLIVHNNEVRYRQRLVISILK